MFTTLFRWVSTIAHTMFTTVSCILPYHVYSTHVYYTIMFTTLSRLLSRWASTIARPMFRGAEATCASRDEDGETATHCNTLQHTATHCNTLQHIATLSKFRSAEAITHCSTLQHAATLCNTLQHTASNTLQHTAEHEYIYVYTCTGKCASDLWATFFLIFSR